MASVASSRSSSDGSDNRSVEADGQATIEHLLEEGKLDVFRWEDDDIALRAAANSSCLSFDRLSAQEASCFPDVVDNKATRNLYFFIRNKMLQMWHAEPNIELTYGDLYQNIPAPYNSDKKLLRRVFLFLERYGYINFGFFHRLHGNIGSGSKKHIIVLGAGASGIASAMHLRHMGFKVTVLEARKRTGGRISSYKHRETGVCVDLGAGVIMGIEGNPITTLMKQLPCSPFRFRTNCPLYDGTTGKLIDQRKDKLIHHAFRLNTECVSFLTHSLNVDSIDGVPYSLQKAYEGVLLGQELQFQRRRQKFWKNYQDTLNKAVQIEKEISLYVKAIKAISDKLVVSDEDIFSLHGPHSELQMKCMRMDLTIALKKCTHAQERLKALHSMLKDLRRQEPSEVYMNQKDKRLLDWHLAYLEMVNNAPLDQISAKHWDQDNEFAFPGSHMGSKDSLASLFVSLAGKLNDVVKLECEATKIEYDIDGVKIHYTEGVNGQKSTIEGDAVICTLPLSLLKLSVDPATESKGVPEFHPPLPSETSSAIRRMGFGNFNKVVLLFDKVFWNTEYHFFGSTSTSSESRGEMFMFLHVPGTNFLCTFMAGKAAALDAPNEAIVKKIMNCLQLIFGSALPKGTQPREAVITRWNKDCYSRGSNSFVPVGEDGSLYDELAQTVYAPGADGKPREPRIFFAGEHTSKRYPATVHGAWLSGIREAAKIADHFLGCPFTVNSENENECVLLDSDGEDEVTPAPVSSDDCKRDEPLQA